MNAFDRAKSVVAEHTYLHPTKRDKLAVQIKEQIEFHTRRERDRICKLEAAIHELLRYAPSGDDYRVMALSLSGRALSGEMRQHIRDYERALKLLEDSACL